MADDVLVLRREQEKDLLRDVNERLGFYVAACKKTEDERDQLAEELASRTARYKQELSSLKEELSARQSELATAQADVTRLSSLETSHVARIKELTHEVARNDKAARELAIAREELKAEVEGHAKTRSLLERIKKEADEARKQAHEATQSERKLKAQLGAKQVRVESLEKSLKDLEKSKAEAVEALIKKKDEEIHAAYQGWLSETNKKVEAVERKLHEEHQAELRELEGRMKEMQQELVERTTTLQQLTGRYDESVKELDRKVKELANKYRNNVLSWERKVNELEDEKGKYYADLEEARRKYHALINTKIAYDEELLQMKGVLDAEEVRLKKRRRPEPADDQTVLRRFKHVILKGGVVLTEVHPDKRFLVVQNQGEASVDMTGWTIKFHLGERDLVYHFPRHFEISGYATVTVRAVDVGKGKGRRAAASDDGSELEWSMTGPWDVADGFTVTLRDAGVKDVCAITFGPQENADNLPDKALASAIVTPDRPPPPGAGYLQKTFPSTAAIRDEVVGKDCIVS